jgi:hypothetical protein
MAFRAWLFPVLIALSVPPITGAQDPCVSGLTPGQRPGPYSFVVSTGKERGQSTCFICATGDNPAVVIFARKTSDELGKLAAELDKAVGDSKNAPLRGWITFLSADQPKFDPQVVDWGKKYAVRTLPLGVFEDADGPPSYRLAKDADVTVLLYVKQKVVANFAYRGGELTEAARAEVIKSIPKILDKK